MIKYFTLLHFLITCGVHNNIKMCVLFTLSHIVLYCLLKLSSHIVLYYLLKSFILKGVEFFSVCEAFRMISQQLVWVFVCVCLFLTLVEEFLYMKVIVIYVTFSDIHIFFLSFKIVLPRTYQILWVLVSSSIFLLACIMTRLAFKNNFQDYS